MPDFDDWLDKEEEKKIEERLKKRIEDLEKKEKELKGVKLSRSQKEWADFSLHMMSQYLSKTDEKYKVGDTELCYLTDYKTLIWNILKYSLRLFNNAGKEYDLEKIAHYAQMAWNKRLGKIPEEQK